MAVAFIGFPPVTDGVKLAVIKALNVQSHEKEIDLGEA
jgi:hypothetical protein